MLKLGAAVFHAESAPTRLRRGSKGVFLYKRWKNILQSGFLTRSFSCYNR